MLTFDESTHTYRVGGKVVPSVTQILRPIIDFSGIDPAVLAAKADLGTRVHAACEFWDQDDLDESSVEDDVAPRLQAWQRFVRESDARVLYAERRVYEPMLGYAGTLDAVIEMGGRRVIVDRKTSDDVPASAGPQTAAYLRALGDISVTRRAVVLLGADGRHQYVELTAADDMATFVACLTVWRFRARHNDADKRRAKAKG